MAERELKINLDPENLTLAQADFLVRTTGLGINDFADMLERREFPPSVLIAIIAIGLNPNTPDDALAEARSVTVANAAELLKAK